MTEPRAATINDVARIAGVAVSSVSRVLSNHPDVSEAMRSRVHAVAKDLGYVPDPVAQSLRSGSTRTIGFVVRDFANAFFGEIIHGVEETLTQAGYTLLVTNSGGDPAVEVERITLLRQRRVDALLLSSVSDRAAETKRAVEHFRKPVVLLDRDFGAVRAGNVQLDHASGVREATEDLIRLGHRRIGMITGSTDIRPTAERLRGLEEGYSAAGVTKPDELLVTGVFSSPFAQATAVRLLSLPKSRRPTALVTGGLQSTIGVLEALSELRIRPGEELSLVVCDDVPWLRVLRPAISVVTRDALGMGRAAAELVLEMVAGGPPRTTSLPTTYLARETSNPAARARSRVRTPA
jgi:LacI family transcriptional regulator